MINYDPLWKTLVDHKMTKTDLIKICNIGSNTIARLGKNEYIGLKVIDQICDGLNEPIERIVRWERTITIERM